MGTAVARGTRRCGVWSSAGQLQDSSSSARPAALLQPEGRARGTVWRCSYSHDGDGCSYHFHADAVGLDEIRCLLFHIRQRQQFSI